MKIVIALVALVVFLAVSAGLARVLSASSAERGAIHALVVAEGRGDATEVTHLITGCGAQPACRARQVANAKRVMRAGVVKLLSVDPSTRIVVSPTSGITRVAWQAGNGRPVVQCVGIRRTGNVVSGLGVELVSLGAPIDPEGSCPS